ncbi:MAG TPA: hypothetical protein PKN48_07920 [Bacteroidales bacterium]|nr:hypothetical protein [Bacteroidales bacterium]
MLRRYFLSLAIIAIVAFSSCKNAEKEKQIAKIDSLITVLDTASQHLNKINIDTVTKKYQAYQATNKLVATHYQKYRNEENWKYLCEYQNVRKPFKNMLKNYKSFRNDLNTSREQLENLRHDVDKKLLDDSEFRSYFTIEAHSVNDLAYRINGQVKSVLYQYQNFDTIQPYLLKLAATYPKDKPSEK